MLPSTVTVIGLSAIVRSLGIDVNFVLDILRARRGAKVSGTVAISAIRTAKEPLRFRWMTITPGVSVDGAGRRLRTGRGGWASEPFSVSPSVLSARRSVLLGADTAAAFVRAMVGVVPGLP